MSTGYVLAAWGVFVAQRRHAHSLAARSAKHFALSLYTNLFPALRTYAAKSRDKKTEIFYALSAWANRRYTTVLNSWAGFVVNRKNGRRMELEAVELREFELQRNTLK
jgi:hypothetical protein